MRVNVYDIEKRLTPWNKRIAVYANDIDNAYPERMDRLINNSVTAKSAATIMVQYLIGKGYGEVNDQLVVNGSKRLSLIDFADDFADDLVKQRGAFIHVNWDANFKITDICLLPFENCRIGKKDSEEYSGKILYCKDWVKAAKKDVLVLDVFNPKKKVIEAQVAKAGDWEKYKGQVLYVNMDTKLLYPLSRIDSVAKDCDSEAQAQIYKHTLLRRGFFGNTLVVTRPLNGTDNFSKYIEGDEGQKINPEWLEATSEQKQFNNAIRDTMGAANAGGVIVIQADFDDKEPLEKHIYIKQVQSNLDDKLFSYSEDSVRQNILVAFNNLPAGLVKTADSAMFGNSGEAIKEMKRMYWENTTKDRNVLTNTINYLLGLSAKHASVRIRPIDLIEGSTPAEGVETPNKEKLLAQATLKGSVGGVQALLQIQQAVKDGTTDYMAAIAILNEIFGFDELTAKSVLGTPKTTVT